MLVQDIHIEQYNWDARIFCAVTRYDIDRIMTSLHSIRCRGDHAAGAYRSLQRNALGSGFTFSNYRLRRSVVVVALASSAEQFHRCLIHELRHLQSHIASADDISEKSEQVCYLLDQIVGLTHKVCSPLLCGCCRSKNTHSHDKGRQTEKGKAYGARMPVQKRLYMLPQLRKRGA